MKEKNMVDEVLGSQSFHQLKKGVQRYFKWLVIGGIILFILGILLMLMILIGVFNLLISPLLANSAEFSQQGFSIMTEGQKWWEQYFVQEQVQLQEIQQQLDEVRQTLDQQNQQETQEAQN